MVFLVDKKSSIVIQTRDVEEAKSIMFHNKQSKNPLEVIGASDRGKFKILYPEYKDYHFEDMNDYRITNT